MHLGWGLGVYTEIFGWSRRVNLKCCNGNLYYHITSIYIYYSLYWAPVGANKWFKYIWVLLQVNSLFVTTSSYPNRKTLTYRKVNFRESLHIYLKNNREEFCIITKRLIKKCDSYKRKPLDREYPSLCTLLQPLKTME